LIGDVTTIVYNFLGGEMTARFVLKALTVAAIAGLATPACRRRSTN